MGQPIVNGENFPRCCFIVRNQLCGIGSNTYAV